MKKMFRQGDVLIIETSKIPSGDMVKKDKNRVILAYGEVTGHAHAIKERSVVLWQSPDGTRIMSVEKEADLVHEEHDTIVIPPGNYEIRIQREYSPEEIRSVAD